MTIERTVLLSILKLTQEGPISKELVSKNARAPVQVAEEMLEKISSEGLVQLSSKVVDTSMNQRVKIAVRAIKLGADIESVSKALTWDEFENITATTFSANNFTVTRRFRFRDSGRRWEIDVIGCREPIIVCVDCKHWRHGWGKSASARAVEKQIERTKALVTVLPKHRELGVSSWRKAVLIPVILALSPSPLKFYKNTPIVPILRLQNFLNELPARIGALRHFSVNL
ncbi:MAG: hypothetical protein ACE5L6_04705 [Candidatus Bathyarchaeia archaeon]